MATRERTLQIITHHRNEACIAMITAARVNAINAFILPFITPVLLVQTRFLTAVDWIYSIKGALKDPRSTPVAGLIATTTERVDIQLGNAAASLARWRAPWTRLVHPAASWQAAGESHFRILRRRQHRQHANVFKALYGALQQAAVPLWNFYLRHRGMPKVGAAALFSNVCLEAGWKGAGAG